MYVIVGLGNPGAKYKNTHHNAGFDVLEILSQAHRIPLNRTKCKALVGEGVIAGARVALCQPQTFMNLSGESVVALCNWYKPEFDQLIVVYDDVDLPFAKIRVRAGGSAGTHNGMRSIISLLGRDDFPRVRVGMGSAPAGWDLADYVLSGYTTKEEREAAFSCYTKAADTVTVLIRDGVPKASAFASSPAQ
ncbi:MAG: aminoacyl-tRNA hydrolase [Clostridia bacterium]